LKTVHLLSSQEHQNLYVLKIAHYNAITSKYYKL
jgi:hypothetical protein